MTKTTLILPSESDLRSSLDRTRHRVDPVAWVNDRLKEHLWSKQKEILYSVRDHRRTAVHSCHGPGKSFCSARVICWFMSSFPVGKAFAVTTASKGAQVKAVLWREIARAHAKGKLPGRLNQTEWWMQPVEGNEELVAFGRKPADMDTSAFQGIHAQRVLVVLDEAQGITTTLWDSLDSLLSNEKCRMLAIGNPEPETEFENVCKAGSGWNVIHISYLHTPNFTSEEVPEDVRDVLIGPTWVEEKKRKWGETNPLYVAKVLGEFPKIMKDGVFHPTWIRQAQEYEADIPESLIPLLPNELGVDVGGGRNKSVIAHRLGSRVRIVQRDSDPNTMVLLGHVIQQLKLTGASIAKVDKIGIGKGVVDRAEEIVRNREANWVWCQKIKGANVALPSNEPEDFINLRAETYWTLRTRAETSTLDLPSDSDLGGDDLAAQLLDLKWRPSGGRTQIESKEEIRRSGRTSPDEADAVMLSFLKMPSGMVVEEEQEEIDLVLD